MRWKHKCDLDWLKARQQCLTATDVKDLLPVTRTGRKRTIGDDDYIKVLSRKMVLLTDDDCYSSGAAARGHILEPYAIDFFNENLGIQSPRLYHWDDVVITKANHKAFGLSFSPDAMNLPMDYEIRRVNQRLFNGSDATVIGEVKCYSAEKHMICGYIDPKELEERWQIATAMAVSPDIKTAHLMFYNPSMRNQLYIADYDRQDLSNEIDTILEVEDNWLGWIANLSKIDHNHLLAGDINREQFIVDEIIKSEELNPDDKKSVVR